MIRVSKTVRNIILGVCIPIFMVLAIYVFVAVYYSGHFYPGTWINGVECSNASVSSVVDRLSEDHDDFVFHITERDDKTESLKGGDIGYKASYTGVTEVKHQQGMWLWPLSFADINFYTVESVPDFDADKLKAAIRSLEGVAGSSVEAPQDAYVDYSDGVRIVPEVQGNTIDQAKLYDVLAEAIRGGENRIDIDAAGCYQVPAVTLESEEFKRMTAGIRKIADTVIKLHIGGDQYETINSDVIYKWLYKGEDDSISIDEEKVSAYMTEMEAKYETWGKDKQFTTTYGSQITISGGNYGWSIDVKKETEQIIEELKAGESVERDVINDSTAAHWGDDEIGNTYVEISIDNQHMWFYKDGQLLVDTDVVTGCLNKGHSTPKGIYTILNKAMHQVLKSNDPKDPYESKVTFWLPFLGNSYGIHDASWRGSYGGKIYYNNGSHGCVNTPYKKVQVIYENIEIGTPVVIY